MSPTMAAFSKAREEGGTMAGVGAAVEANMGPQTHTAIGGITSLLSGDIVGGLVELISASSQMKAIMGYVEGVAGDILDAFGALLEPLAPLIGVVGTLARAVLPIVTESFKLLEPAFQMIFEAVKRLAGIIAGVAAAIEWIITAAKNALYEGLLTILLKIQSVSDYLVPDSLIASVQEGITAQKSFWDTVTDAYNEFEGLDFETLKNNIAKTNDAVSDALEESATNLPMAVRVARARFLATREQEQAGYRTAVEAYTSGGLPTTDAYAPAGSGARAFGPAAAAEGSFVIENATFNIMSNDPDRIVAVIKRHMRQQALLENGSGAAP
jgi:uncharacterized membrane protein YkgB